MNLFNKILQLMMKIPVLQNIRLLFYFYDSIILLFTKNPKKAKVCEGKNVGDGRKKILLVFPFALGDCVMFLGAAKYIREIYPSDSHEITVACQGAYKGLFGAAFDRVLPFNFTKCSVSPSERAKMLKGLRSTYYDVAIDPIGAHECTPNVYAMNAVCADEKIGVMAASDKKRQCPEFLRKKAYTDLIEISEKNIHKNRYYAIVFSRLQQYIKKNVSSKQQAGGEQLINSEQQTGREESINSEQMFKPALADLSAHIASGAELDLPKRYFIVYPSASIPVKQWPVERYARAAKLIYEKLSCPLLLCGTAADKEATDELKSQLEGQLPIVDMLGKTNVPQFISVIGQAQLVLTNDTSVYHIAVATGRKTCVVSGGYVYDTFLNYVNQGYEEGIENRVKIAAHTSECMNCDNNCKFKVEKTYPCVEEVSVEEVLGKLEELLK